MFEDKTKKEVLIKIIKTIVIYFFILLPVVLSILFFIDIINYFKKYPDEKSNNKSIFNLAYTYMACLIIAFVLIILAKLLSLRNISDNTILNINRAGIFLYFIHVLCVISMLAVLITKDEHYKYKYEIINTEMKNKYKMKLEYLGGIYFWTGLLSILIYAYIILKHYNKN